MTPEERISLLDLDIKKIQLDLAKVESYLQKMKDMRHEEAVKISILQANLDFLRNEPVIVSLMEASNTVKNMKKLTGDIKLMDLEISKLEKSHCAYKQSCDKLITERNTLLQSAKKGVLLQFKRN